MNALNIITGFGQSIRLPEIIINGVSDKMFNISENWQFLLILIYFIGVIILLVRILTGIFTIMRLKTIGERINYDRYTVVYTRNNLPPFSFFQTIFLNESFKKNHQKSQIINHEMIHIRQFHTYDNLIVEIFLTLFWFNPFIWLLRNSLRSTHEYLADHACKNEGASLSDYQSLLIGQINRLSPISISNNFNSLIKNRIKMMFRSKSTVIAKFKPLLVLPVMLFLTLIFACNEFNNNTETKSMQEKSKLDVNQIQFNEDSVPIAFKGEAVFNIVEEMPKFQGQEFGAFRDYIAKNLKYPELAKEKKISGKVYVQFIVDYNGEVSWANVVRGVNPILDQEAIRVTRSSPVWEPGKQGGHNVSVLFTFPINFVLE
jgi:TonB family protein